MRVWRGMTLRRANFLDLLPGEAWVLLTAALAAVILGLLFVQGAQPTYADNHVRITSVAVSSSPDHGDTYGAGETIEIAATFSVDVEVDGNPALGIWIGGTWETAEYLRGSGSSKLVFGYTVEGDDRDSNGISMDGGYRDDQGRWHNFINYTAITDVGGDTTPWRNYRGLGHQSDHKVDGRPRVVSVDFTSEAHKDRNNYIYGAGETIEVTMRFNEPVDVEGKMAIALNVGGTDEDSGTWTFLRALTNGRSAVYAAGSGTDSLKFRYVVNSRDKDDDGVSVPEGTDIYGFNGSGSISSVATDEGHNRLFPAEHGGIHHRVNGAAAWITDVKLASTPHSGSTFVSGEAIDIDITFTEAVEVSGGTPRINILVSSSNYPTHADSREVMYSSGSGTKTLRFSYDIQESDRDSNGFDILNEILHSIDQGGDHGNIKTASSKERAMQGFDSIELDYRIDGSRELDRTAPTISSMDVTSDAGDDNTYGVDDVIEITVTFSEDVTVTGTPQLELNFDGDNGSAAYSSSDSSGADLVFKYTVQVGDSASDGLGVLSNKLTLPLVGGSIRDAAGNNANLAHSQLGPLTAHLVSGVDNTPPTISSVAITSNPGDDNTYGHRDTIKVTVTFSETVLVTGAPQLELDFDGTAKTAGHSSTHGSNAVFKYTVALNDSDDDGIAIGANKLTLNGGSIKDVGNNDATLTHDAVPADDGHKVDGEDTTDPTVSSVSIIAPARGGNTFLLGEDIHVSVSFSEDVVVTGTPQLELDFDGTAKTAEYLDSSRAEVVFSYTVALDDMSDNNIEINDNPFSLNGGTIQDEAGNDADLAYTEIMWDPGYYVDGRDKVAPTIMSMAFTSDAGEDNTYGTSDIIEITVTFSEDVTVTGTPQLELNFDGDNGFAAYSSSASSGANVVFTYTVQVGDRASDGLAVLADKLTLNGGTIQDPSANDAVLTHSQLGPSADHFVRGAGGV